MSEIPVTNAISPERQKARQALVGIVGVVLVALALVGGNGLPGFGEMPLELLKQRGAAQAGGTEADLTQQCVGGGPARLLVVFADARIVMLELVPGGVADDKLGEYLIHVGGGKLARHLFPGAIKFLGGHLHEQGNGPTQMHAQPLGDRGVEIDASTGEHPLHERHDLGIRENG